MIGKVVQSNIVHEIVAVKTKRLLNAWSVPLLVLKSVHGSKRRPVIHHTGNSREYHSES